MPATLHHTAATEPAPPRVSTRRGLRTLEFQPGMVQSEMSLADPDRLVLSYARAMMCFVLFQPRPAHIVLVGLGGGSLAKFCHRYLPHSRITVIELRADVIALREQFAVPPDDERLRVVHADASRYMATLRGAADVLLVDGFDEDGLPPALGSAAFYADCWRALRPGGVLVANVFSYDPQYPAVLRRLRACFQQRVAVSTASPATTACCSPSSLPAPRPRLPSAPCHGRPTGAALPGAWRTACWRTGPCSACAGCAPCSQRQYNIIK